MKYSACLEVLYKELPLTERIAAAKKDKFSAVEFWGLKNHDTAAILEQCRKNSIEIALFNSVNFSQVIDDRDSKSCINEFADSVEIAKMLACRNLVVHTNIIEKDGRAKQPGREIPDDKKRANVIDFLRHASPLAEKENITILLEPLNTYVDHPGYFLSNTADAVKIIEKTKCKNIKILYDFYHMQIMQGNLTANLEKIYDYIGHIHFADVPKRDEPGNGEINFGNILKELIKKNYSHYIGFELIPSKDTETAVGKIKKIFSF